MYKNVNKGKKSIANSSTLYQIYTPVFSVPTLHTDVHLKPKPKSGSP